ncbi:TPA: EpsG family protein [Clostridium perfringens]|nr:EpsG family protein [Clostridium perfringens]
MTLIFYLEVILMNIFTGIFYGKRNKKKFSIIILFFSFIIVYLLMAGYRNTSGFSKDLLYSEIEFNNINSGVHSNYEVGYILLIKLGGIFTKDFYTFRAGIIAIFLLILFWSIIKWSPSPHYVIALFSSYLVILSSEQLRYFLGFVIFEVGLCILIYSENKRKRLIYSIFLLIASSIHFSFLIYFIFLLNSTSVKSKKEKFIAILTCMFCVIIFINNNKIPGLSELLEYVNSDKMSIYMSQSTNLGFLYPFLLHISSLILTFWSLMLSIKLKDNKERSIIKYVYRLDLLAIVFFPLYMLQISFYRLARSMLMINYNVYSEIIISKEIDIGERILFVFIVWLSVILWVVIDLTIKTPAQSLLIPFFEGNVYLNF